jgi:membrane associated rhomboid family serine protease
MLFPILILTVLISIFAFNRNDLAGKLRFNAYLIYHKKQWYRMLTHGLVHAGWMHLIINMLVFYSFGISVFQIFTSLHEAGISGSPGVIFLMLYLGGLIFSSLLTLYKYRNIPTYNAVGASGAVSAIVFTSIFFDPWRKIYFYGVIGLPGILLGLAYLFYSWYMGKRDTDNINHDAHFTGALFGLLFPILLDYELVFHFFNHLMQGW